MDAINPHLLPLVLILARVAAFMGVLPVFGSRGIPTRVKAGLALVMAVATGMIVPPPAVLPTHWLEASLMLVREMLCGLAFGVSVAIVFAAVHQAGEIIRIQMGMAEAETFDPLTGDETQAMGVLLDMTFLLLFLSAGGHHLLLQLILRSYDAFPIGQTPSAAVMAESLIQSGTLVLVFGLKLAAPLMAAFLLLTVVLGVLARAMPEMNVLMASFPLRVGLGFFIAATFLPSLSGFTRELGDWLNGFWIQ